MHSMNTFHQEYCLNKIDTNLACKRSQWQVQQPERFESNVFNSQSKSIWKSKVPVFRTSLPPSVKMQKGDFCVFFAIVELLTYKFFKVKVAPRMQWVSLFCAFLGAIIYKPGCLAPPGALMCTTTLGWCIIYQICCRQKRSPTPLARLGSHLAEILLLFQRGASSYWHIFLDS